MKKISKILLIFISMFIIGNVKAAGTSRITISPSSRTYVVGNTFTVTVTVSATEPMAGLSYTLQYNSSVLSLESTTASTGGARNLDAFMNNTTTSVSYTYRFRAKNSGTSTISVTGAEVRNASNALSVSTSTATIKVMTQAQILATYSSNNNLSSLSVNGYDLEPAFSQDVTEYKVTLKPETEMINVVATKADSTASVNGVGDIAVSEGTNTIRIDVVAQNGNIKTYVINATVAEYDPINVLVDGEKYTVVRSKKAQNFNNQLFTETEVQIGEYNVPAYYNEITNTTLVGLKNTDGEISYFIYKNGEYRKFDELKLGLVDLMILTAKENPVSYEKAVIDIGEKEYNVYKFKETSRFCLIYGTNLVNNYTGFYVYDNYEHTLQRYDDTIVEYYENELKKDKYYLYVFAGGTGVLFLLLFIALAISSGQAAKKTKVKDMESLDNETNNIEKVIEKVSTNEDTKEESQKELMDYVDNIEKNREHDIMEEFDKAISDNIDDIEKAISVTDSDNSATKTKKKTTTKTKKKKK